MAAASPVRRPSGVAVWSALIALYIFWGSTYLGIRIAIESFPPFLMASGRFLVAGGILVAFARVRGTPAPTRREWVRAAIVGTLLLTIGNGAVAWAEQVLPSGLVALTVTMSPVWLVVLDFAFNRVRISWPQAVGVLLGVAGMAILVNPGGAGASLVPLVVLVGTSVAWAAGTLLSRSRDMPRSTTLANGMSMLAGAVGLLVLGLATGEASRVHPAAFSAASFLAVGWLIVFGSLVGFSSYLWLIRVAPVVLVSTQSYVSPVIAVVLGAVVLGERITPRSLVAGAVILVAVVLIATAPLLTSRTAAEQLPRGKAA